MGAQPPNSMLQLLAEPNVVVPGLTPDEAVGFVHYLIAREKVSPARVSKRIEVCLDFLRQCVAEPDVRHMPSHRVDVVWHGMILHTQWYQRLCQALGTPFIHHRPNDWKVMGQNDGAECDDNCSVVWCGFDDCSE